MTLFQTVAAQAAPTITLESLAVGFTGVVLAGFWRDTRGLQKEIRSWRAKIDTTLFGPEGSNGLNGTVKDHEQRIRVLEQGDSE